MSQKKILIVDDDIDISEIIKTILEMEGYEVTIAYDGMSALDISYQKKPDLVLLDIMMPGMDGWDVLKRLKACRKTLHIPVAMVTARINPEEKIKAFKEGAEEFITKPLHIDDFLRRINRLFHKEEEERKKYMFLLA
ncbi:MAG: response regulator [bacterium]